MTYRYLQLVPEHPPLPHLQRWYDAIAAGVEHCDIIRVSAEDQKSLKKYSQNCPKEVPTEYEVLLKLSGASFDNKKLFENILFARENDNFGYSNPDH